MKPAEETSAGTTIVRRPIPIDQPLAIVTESVASGGPRFP
jgi:hypothetical protein